MSSDAPTERFEAPQVTTDSGGGKKSKKLILILSIVGGLLLLAVVVLVTVLLTRGFGPPTTPPTATPSASNSETPSASPSETPSKSPSASPSETPSAAPPPPPSTGPVFNTFSPKSNKSVGCSDDSTPVTVTFTWTSTGADEAAIGVETTDAFAGPFQTGLPPSGSFDLNYQCSKASQFYTVSIRGTSGQTNKTITLKH